MGHAEMGVWMSEWVLPEGVLRDAPTYTPRPHELADLELLLTGAYAPLTGFAGEADVTAITRGGHLADGGRWRVRVTWGVPGEVVGRTGPAEPVRRILVLTDPEGAPVAAVEAVETSAVRDGWFRVGGPVRRIG